MQTLQFLNLKALDEAVVKNEPYPYMVIPNILNEQVKAELINNFPKIDHRGSIPADTLQPGSLFKQFTQELEGDFLRNWLATKFGMDLQNKPTMLTLRGHTTERDGVIHTDSKSKMITVLIYMNPTWDTTTGKLRLLNNKHSLDDFAEEISPLAGSCVIFKVTPNCWHGHYPFVGKRLSLQLNYLTGEAALNKHLNHHRFTAWLKRLFPGIFSQKQETY